LICFSGPFFQPTTPKVQIRPPMKSNRMTRPDEGVFKPPMGLVRRNEQPISGAFLIQEPTGIGSPLPPPVPPEPPSFLTLPRAPLFFLHFSSTPAIPERLRPSGWIDVRRPSPPFDRPPSPESHCPPGFDHESFPPMPPNLGGNHLFLCDTTPLFLSPPPPLPGLPFPQWVRLSIFGFAS